MIHYPRLLRRIRGAMIDGVVIPVAVLGALVGLSSLGVEDAVPKIIAAVAIILLLEPVAVTVTGGTIGHHLAGIRVRRSQGPGNLGFFAAVVRFITKSLFGLPSFLLLLITQRRQSLHDLAARSVVVFKTADHVPEYEKLKEYTAEDEGRAYASVWRRLAVILLYWLLIATALSLFLDFAVSLPCLHHEACAENEAVLLGAAPPVLLMLWALIAFLGWRGFLPGCRRRRVAGG